MNPFTFSYKFHTSHDNSQMPAQIDIHGVGIAYVYQPNEQETNCKLIITLK